MRGDHPSAWIAAVLLLESFLQAHAKLSDLLDLLPRSVDGPTRANCQRLLLGALRNGHLVETALAKRIRRTPKARLRAAILIAGAEALEAPDTRSAARIVHHAVEQTRKLTSKEEGGFLNALLRALPGEVQRQFPKATERHAAAHPTWLSQKWSTELDGDTYAKLLAWNLQPSDNFLYAPGQSTIDVDLPTDELPGFFRLPRGPLPTLAEDLILSGKAYIKDPGTRFAVEALAPGPGDSVLDLCAAPGGKSFHIAHAIQHQGQIVAIDLPGPRFKRLSENLSRLQSHNLQVAALEADILKLTPEVFTDTGLPSQFSKVIIDVPCSNTGVLGRRPDVLWRLREGDIAALIELQLQLLEAAARCVQPGGSLVYSTCSIEPEENSGCVERFLEGSTGTDFKLISGTVNFPGTIQHDGGGIFLLHRKTSG